MYLNIIVVIQINFLSHCLTYIQSSHLQDI